MPAFNQITLLTANYAHFQKFKKLCKMHYVEGHPVFNDEFLSWIYLENPAGIAKLIVASEGDEWIGVMALIPIVLECDEPQSAYFVIHVLTHPEHRKKNLFVKMIRFARDELSNQGVWLLGHPNASAKPFWKRQKMEFRDSLFIYFAKIRIPFSGYKESRIKSFNQLKQLPEEFWKELSRISNVHIKYSPEFIAWRFLDAPHKEYIVTSVEKNGNLLGLRVTRRYKGPIDLMIDCIGTKEAMGDLLKSAYRPTLIMHSGVGSSEEAILSSSLRIPVKREIPFFVTTWQCKELDFDVTGITLAASDF